MKFSDEPFQFPFSLRHQGIVFVFATNKNNAKENNQEIGYRVLDVKPDIPDDDKGWTSLKKLSFPKQLRLAGKSLVTLPVDQATKVVVNVPFQALSDGRHIYIFRQSNDSTILVDRFIVDFATKELQPNVEPRYQRSRKKDIPANRKDSLDYTSMENELFYEPTTELKLPENVGKGCFSILLLPTNIPNQQRWQIFACDSSGYMHSYSIRRSEDGLFDMADVHHTYFKAHNELGKTEKFDVGPAALLYMQQEQITDQYDRFQKVKRGMRVMLAAPTDFTKRIAMLDFAVAQDGILTKIPPGKDFLLPDIQFTGEKVPLKPLLTDNRGLSLRGGFLNSFYTYVSPMLLDSADGLLHLYFREGGKRFMVAQYDTTIRRARISLPLTSSDQGAVDLVALQPGAVMNSSELTVEDGSDNDNCHVLMENDDIVEKWRDVPRRLDRFTAVLLGATTKDKNDPAIAANKLVAYDVAKKRAVTFKRPAFLTYDVPVGFGAIRATSTKSALPVIGEPAIKIIAETSAKTCAISLTLKIKKDGADVTINETWKNVPRQPDRLVKVLNGQTTNDKNDPRYQNGEVEFYDVKKRVLTPASLKPNSDASYLFTFTDQESTGELRNQSVEQVWLSHEGSILVTVDTELERDNATLVAVANTVRQQVIQEGIDPGWIPEPQGNALIFDGDLCVFFPPDKLEKSMFQGDLTMEAWLNLKESNDDYVRLLNYHLDNETKFAMGLQKVKGADGKFSHYLPFASSGETAVSAKPDSLAGQIKLHDWTHLAAVYNASKALKLDGEGYVDCGNDITFNQVEAMTIEAWVQRDRQDKKEAVVTKWGIEDKDKSWKLFIDEDNRPCFAIHDSTREIDMIVMGPEAILKDQPTHLAGTFDTVAQKETALSFNDGNYVDIPANNDLSFPGTMSFTIEAWINPQEGRSGGVIFGRFNANVTGEYFLKLLPDGRLFFQREVAPYHITTIDPVIEFGVFSHVAAVYDGDNQQIQIYVNGISCDLPEKQPVRPITSKSMSNQIGCWFANNVPDDHFYGQISNVRLWKKALDVDGVRKSMLTPTSQVTGPVGHWPLDSVDKLQGKAQDRAGTNDGILYGKLLFNEIDKCSYRQKLYVNGKLVSWRWIHQEGDFTLGEIVDEQEDEKMSLLINGTEPELRRGDILLLPDNSGKNQDEQMRITEVRTGRPTSLLWVKRPVNGTKAIKHNLSKSIKVLRKRTGREDAIIALTAINETNTNINIGRTASGVDYFQGTIDEVRLWKVERKQWQIIEYQEKALPGNAEGLVASWCFDEGRGKIALDDKQTNHGRLIHADKKKIDKDMWTSSRLNSSWSLYVDGKGIQVDSISNAKYGGLDPLQFGQFGLGGYTEKRPNEIKQGVNGQIDEVRIWNSPRTHEAITDNMYRFLDGSEESLIAYWKLDEGPGKKIEDHSGNGQESIFSIDDPKSWSQASAPIGNEPPEVLHVYNGLERRRNKLISGTPTVAEYGDMQWDAEGNLRGVMKRCYIYQELASGDIHLLTGFKIGDLELQFIGQVQTAPTLIGYIEGAPPVPSENLTVNDSKTDDYVGTSMVQLTEAHETTQIYSASRETGFDMSMDLKLGVYAKTDTTAGLGIQQKIFAADSKVGAHAYFEYSHGFLNTATISSSSSRTMTNALVLGGGWEEPKDYDNNGQPRYLNPQVGRRYVPNNMGYALVKSGTADLFALRLKRSGSLVAFQILPNPDIPEDWNIIMFPLNPKYVKNGTLDGMVGLTADEDYPNARLGERGSYFKPLEAYALKAKIDRNAKKMTAYYDKFDAETKGYTDYSGDDEKGGLFAELPTKDLTYDWQEREARRSLVNTYVWTADGGFFAEEEQFSSTRQESLGGSYHFLGKGGIVADLKLAFTVGVFFEMDAMFGGHINSTVTQTKEEQAGFGLNVNLIGEGFLNKWVGDQEKQQGYYVSEPCPGKVDGYRFMTFYLTPESSHFKKFFNEVVDQNWLNERGPYAGQYLPNARALREAKNNINDVWRVMHRVTFVSRIPPKFETSPEESTPKDVRRPDNVVENIGLIEAVAEKFTRLYPGVSLAEATLVQLGKAVDRWLGEFAMSHWWADLDNIFTDKQTRLDDKKAVRQELRRDIMAYLKGYFELDHATLTGSLTKPVKPPKPVQPGKPKADFYITSPKPGQAIKGVVNIVGTARLNPARKWGSYKLEIKGGQWTDWTTFGDEKSNTVIDGVLEKLHADSIPPGTYTIRLVLIGHPDVPKEVDIKVVK